MQNIKFMKPNFSNLWENASYYPELKQMGKQKWCEFANLGYNENYTEIKNNIQKNIKQNHTYKNMSEEGKLEMPLAIKFSEEEYHLISGSNILQNMDKMHLETPVWIIDLSNCIYAI
jgi:hypothetical protein